MWKLFGPEETDLVFFVAVFDSCKVMSLFSGSWSDVEKFKSKIYFKVFVFRKITIITETCDIKWVKIQD